MSGHTISNEDGSPDPEELAEAMEDAQRLVGEMRQRVQREEYISAFDPEDPTKALATLGRMMAEIVGDDPPDDDEEENVVRLIHEALDLVDRAIEILAPEEVSA